ncbi:MAG TPA: chromate transporter [Stellaceae bacterium]|jgi:chromate transporter|nr:chromate transporter [Stellaceae bacterium]
MSTGSASTALVSHLTLLSLISFGGIPAALPDLRDYVIAHQWMTDQDFANCFAVVQAIPGPNMILLTSFIGWQVGGLPAAIAAGLATFVPSCALCFASFQVWDRFRDTGWQPIVRRGLAPVTIGLVVAGGFVVARAGDTGWASAALTVAAGALLLVTRVNPLWIIAAAGVIGGCGLL